MAYSLEEFRQGYDCNILTIQEALDDLERRPTEVDFTIQELRLAIAESFKIMADADEREDGFTSYNFRSLADAILRGEKVIFGKPNLGVKNFVVIPKLID